MTPSRCACGDEANRGCHRGVFCPTCCDHYGRALPPAAPLDEHEGGACQDCHSITMRCLQEAIDDDHYDLRETA